MLGAGGGGRAERARKRCGEERGRRAGGSGERRAGVGAGGGRREASAARQVGSDRKSVV